MKKTQDLFLYDRSLPEPFKTCSKSRASAICSYPSSSKKVTAFGPMIKAINAFLKMRTSKDYSGGLGWVNPNMTICEYKSSIENTIHAIAFDRTTGKSFGSVYNTVAATRDKYVGGKSDKCRDNTAIFLAMLPVFMENAEFLDNLDKYANEAKIGFPNIEKALDYVGVCCENAYRRILSDDIRVDDTIITPNPVKLSDWQRGVYRPNDIIAGGFVLADDVAVRTTVTASLSGTLVSDIAGKYKISSRKLTEREKSLIPIPQKGMYAPEWALDMLGEIVADPECRNILIYGPSGTGKTVGSKICAMGLGEPLYVQTCAADTDGPSITYEILPRKASNPVKVTLSDIEFDPVGSYAKITGEMNEDATPDDCIIALQEHSASNNGITYDLCLSPVMKAFRDGGVIELQEPSVILQPGVLVKLNSLLEPNGVMELPTGEIIHRHPDCVFIITMNVGYNGCRPLNQSVKNRMNLIYEIPLPERDIITQRCCAEADFKDKELAAELVSMMLNMVKYCKEHRITDGEISVRSMICWLRSIKRTNDIYASAMKTIVRHATFEPKAIDELSALIADKYPPKRGGAYV